MYTLKEVENITTEEQWIDFVFQEAFVENADRFSCKDQWASAESFIERQLSEEAIEHLNSHF